MIEYKYFVNIKCKNLLMKLDYFELNCHRLSLIIYFFVWIFYCQVKVSFDDGYIRWGELVLVDVSFIYKSTKYQNLSWLFVVEDSFFDNFIFFFDDSVFVFLRVSDDVFKKFRKDICKVIRFLLTLLIVLKNRSN